MEHSRRRLVKYRVARFKSMSAALRQLKPLLRFDNARLLRTGRPAPNLGRMLPREMLGNWLVCAALNCDRPGAPLYFTSDPSGGDGLLYDEMNKTIDPVEHVYVPPPPQGETRSADERIGNAVADKASLGPNYASGKILVVLFDAMSRWEPTKVARLLPAHTFEGVFVIARERCVEDEYTFLVAWCKLEEGHAQAPVFRVRIAKEFDRWDVERTQ
jgi:hypothetical protein